MRLRNRFSCLLLMLFAAGCSGDASNPAAKSTVLRLAVTTSTRDSGLLNELAPVFESQLGARVDVIAVGTGAALKLGEAGDVDVLLVHAAEAEDAFMAAGHGVRREELMYNMFQILGPANDPAEIQDLQPEEAFIKIAASGQRFVSRGDESGTHMREKKLWRDALPNWKGYLESGQGMGATLTMANELQAYVLSDRGTYLKFKNKIQLVPLVVAAESLKNPYSMMVVNPMRHATINEALAHKFVDFMISKDAQLRIRDYEIDGEQLFYPLQLSNPK